MSKYLKNELTKDIFFLSLPFLMMQAYISFLGSDVSYSNARISLPLIIFIITWVLFLALLPICMTCLWGTIAYGIFFGIFLVAFLANSVYYPLTGSFFGFHLVFMAGEGSSYIVNTLIHTSPITYLITLFILAAGIYAIRRLYRRGRKKQISGGDRLQGKKLVLIIVIFAVIHILNPFLYGNVSKNLKWNSFKNPRYIYNTFYDKNKSMKVCGLFEYTFRDFYITFLKPKEKPTKEEQEVLDRAYASKTSHAANDHTGIYKGKNIIFVQLEGIDTWLLTEETMPYLYSLMENSIEFTDHYSYYNGGGSTFNSELAVNTGFITPVSYTRNAYSFSSNSFPYSLPNMLKQEGYSVNAYHMNTGEFYSRKENYKNWGYENYHGLIDEESYSDITYELDTELLKNENFYNMIFKAEKPFMEYIITYTNHTPFDSSNEVVQYLLNEKYGDNPPDLSEEEYARLLAEETDRMVELLIQGLKDNGLYEDTVLVFYADHYLYTLNDKTILDKYKTTSNNLINRTPFFIWSADQTHESVEKVNGQIDILPTVLNLLGISYTEENYIGYDIFSPDYFGYAFFSDGSMYDGTAYTDDADLPQIEKNDLTLKFDYFK